MKKFLIPFLLAAFILTGCSNEDSNSTTEENTATTSTSQAATSENVAEVTQPTSQKEVTDAFVDIFKTNQYTIAYEIYTEVDQDKSVGNVKMTKKGEEMAMASSSEEGSFRMVMTTDRVYMITDADKTVFSIPKTAEQMLEKDESNPGEIDYGKINYIGSGEEEFMGNMRSYSEYEVEGGKIKYYMDGKNMDGMIMTFEDGMVLMDVTEFNNKSEESLFEIPTDYTLIEQ